LKRQCEAAAANDAVAIGHEVRRSVAQRVFSHHRDGKTQARSRAEVAGDFGVLGGENDVAGILDRRRERAIFARVGLGLGEENVERDNPRAGFR